MNRKKLDPLASFKLMMCTKKVDFADVFEGGEALIYHNENSAYKLFKDIEKAEYKEKKIDKLNELLEKNLVDFVPKVLKKFYTKNEFCAYEMNYIKNSISLEKLNSNIENQNNVIKNLNISLKIAQMLDKLHDLGIVLGDFHSGQIMVDKDDHMKISFIDIDSWGIPKLGKEYYPDNGGILGFEDPDNFDKTTGEKLGYTFSTDYYSCAQVIFRLLTSDVNIFKTGKYQLINSDKETEEILRMNSKISIIDNPNIKCSESSLRWKNWMCSDLQYAFLRIFEEGKRFSLVSYLKEQIELFDKRYSKLLEDAVSIDYYDKFKVDDVVEIDFDKNKKIAYRKNNKAICIYEDGMIKKLNDITKKIAVPYYYNNNAVAKERILKSLSNSLPDAKYIGKYDNAKNTMLTIIKKADDNSCITKVLDVNSNTIYEIDYGNYNYQYIFNKLNISNAILFFNSLYIPDKHRIIKINFEKQNNKYVVTNVIEEKNYIVTRDSMIGFSYLGSNRKLVIISNNNVYIIAESEMRPIVDENKMKPVIGEIYSDEMILNNKKDDEEANYKEAADSINQLIKQLNSSLDPITKLNKQQLNHLDIDPRRIQFLKNQISSVCTRMSLCAVLSDPNIQLKRRVFKTKKQTNDDIYNENCLRAEKLGKRKEYEEYYQEKSAYEAKKKQFDLDKEDAKNNLAKIYNKLEDLADASDEEIDEKTDIYKNEYYKVKKVYEDLKLRKTKLDEISTCLDKKYKFIFE